MTWRDLKTAIENFSEKQLDSQIQGYDQNILEGYTSFKLDDCSTVLAIDQFGIFSRDDFDSNEDFEIALSEAIVILPPDIPYFKLV